SLPAAAISNAVWKLSFDESAGRREVQWASLPGGSMISLADVKARAHAEMQYARTVHEQAKNEGTYKLLDESERKEWALNQKLDEISTKGITSASDYKVLLDGAKD